MNILQAIVLGLIQGLTEFIPVSSSGHLVLAQHLFGIQAGNDISFEVFMHLGTLLAVLIFFRKLIWELIASMFSWKASLDGETHRINRALIMYLIISTLATGVFYIIFEDILKAAYQNSLFVAIMLVITGIIIFGSDYAKNASIPPQTSVSSNL
jgi:undecaprenyl-diphosphatase